MYSGRPKKTFPVGTFIPGPARVCAIVQLCIAFSMILWELTLPFTGEVFKQKSSTMLYEEVLRSAQFEKLPPAHQQRFFAQYDAMKAKQPIGGKLSAGAAQLFVKNSVFKTSWLLFSIILPILLLKRREGVAAAIWILPMLAFCYACDNQFNGQAFANQEALLFPSETQIVENYMDAELSPRISEQQIQLSVGWKRYLIREWLEEIPSQEREIFEQQAKAGSFAFTLARIEKRLLDDATRASTVFRKEHPLFLCAYLLWNLLFALITLLSMREPNRHITDAKRLGV